MAEVSPEDEADELATCSAMLEEVLAGVIAQPAAQVLRQRHSKSSPLRASPQATLHSRARPTQACHRSPTYLRSALQ